MDALPVLLIVANQGYQPHEYAEPKKILEAANIKVETASNKPGVATDKDGETTTVDITIDQIDVKNYAGIFVIGGPGALEHLNNETTYKVIQQAALLKKPFGSICISTRILAKAGVLKNKKVTGWNGDDQLATILKKHNAIYIREKCVVDGNIVTATDPSAATAFGNSIVTIVK